MLMSLFSLSLNANMDSCAQSTSENAFVYLTREMQKMNALKYSPEQIKVKKFIEKVYFVPEAILGRAKEAFSAKMNQVGLGLKPNQVFAKEDKILFPEEKISDKKLYHEERRYNVRDELNEYIDLVLAPDLAPIAKAILPAYENKETFVKFVIQLRKRCIDLMEKDGIDAPNAYINTALIKRYYSSVLTEILQEHSFLANQSKAFSMTRVMPETFFQFLADKKAFMDWNGISLLGGENQLYHGVRGHLFIMAYLSTQIPNFSKLIEYIGTSKDKDLLWSYLFDNTSMLDAFTWNGNVQRYFGEYLGVENF